MVLLTYHGEDHTQYAYTRQQAGSGNQSINQSIYLRKQAASETTVHRAGRP